MSAAIQVLTFVAALGSALMAGMFFVFSSFMMEALERTPVTQRIATMQSINVAVLNRSFLGTFFGTAIVCVVLLVLSAMESQHPGTVYRASGCLLYVFGTFVVTAACNVPRNNALAEVDPEGDGAEAAWQSFASGWTRWNHVRAVAALAALGGLMAALIAA